MLCFIYLHGISVRTAIDFILKNGWKKGPGLLRKGYAGKAFKFVCIKCDLIMSRRVLNTLARVSGKGNFDCQS